MGWRAWGKSEPPTNRDLPGKPSPRSNFWELSHTQLFKLIPPFDGVDPVGPLVGVSLPQIKFYQANPPRGAALFGGLHPILFANTPIWWSGPCRSWLGWAPHKKKFTRQTQLDEHLLLAGPCPIINPLGYFRRFHCMGYPWGLMIWVGPWLVAVGWNDEPTSNFGVTACVGPAVGCWTHIHSCAVSRLDVDLSTTT